MKSMKHPATIIAGLALLVAAGGGTVAYASGIINGAKIKNHSIAMKKFTNSTIKALQPAGKILTYDANAVSGSPTPTSIGTVLGITYGAACTTTGTNASLGLYIKTTDGSWNVDYDYITDEDALIAQDARKINFPAGTLPNSLQQVDSRIAASSEGEGHLDMVQLKPLPGQVTWHESVFPGATPSCHLLVQGLPEPVAATHATAQAPARRTVHLPLDLTH